MQLYAANVPNCNHCSLVNGECGKGQRHWWQSAATTAQLLGDEGAHLVDGDGVICPRHVALGGDVVDLVLK